MRTIIKLLFLLIISLSSLAARADVLVLVHGYLGSADSWEARLDSEMISKNNSLIIVRIFLDPA